MKRRDFSIRLAGAGLGLACVAPAYAQAPAEGRDYVKLSQPVPVTSLPADKKVEVLEFFWYECPHCNALEPMLESWSRRLAPDVLLRRVPVGFTARHQVAQKMLYALEDMGQLAAAHRKVFAAIHVQNQRLTSDGDATALAAAVGLDKAKFADTYKSFGVSTKASKARQLSDAYKVDSVPMLGVHGRFFTSAGLTGSHERALAVADYLIERSRKGV